MFPYPEVCPQFCSFARLITLNSSSTQSDFYRTCFDTFSGFQAQFILSVGWQTNLDELGQIPENFIVRPSVPQLDVLQRTDVFITHGGLNSIHEGLYYGVPLILIPQQFEQLLNSRCVLAKGAGLMIDARLRHKPVTAPQLRQHLEAVLAEPRYRAAAEVLQQSMRAAGGYRQAADEIQAYIAR